MEDVKQEIEVAARSVGREVKVVAVTMDILDPDSVQRAAAEITPEFQGRLDVLISNAGYMEPWTKIIETDLDEWWKSWDINTRGQLLTWKAFLPLLLANNDSLKTCINMSSIGAQMVVPGASAYQTTKFALLRLTEFLNVEYSKQGLIAYCMHPGAVKTELSWKMPDFVKGNLIDTPELMAHTVVFLTQQKREWLRGRYVSCNWNMPELLAMQDEIVEKDKLKMRMVV
jgi:NAD(P)-dependent dehydrogenase (short-subunit alcohol dehydrogenase family)